VETIGASSTGDRLFIPVGDPARAPSSKKLGPDRHGADHITWWSAELADGWQRVAAF